MLVPFPNSRPTATATATAAAAATFPRLFESVSVVVLAVHVCMGRNQFHGVHIRRGVGVYIANHDVFRKTQAAQQVQH